ncbi:cell division cycle-associated protein 2 isoform X3 [Notolabrus celidotus]|uniref:cell division cycle-associated protein 2 isoform X3 n=1 Tax=Notolabrus celidotus TaxID=1203425 RepID=UPI00148FEEB5|nr:cell division cycle-associated protein 2 isoform X3 [Notolabrus celidotus]
MAAVEVMSAVEVNPAATMDDQKEKTSLPSEDVSPQITNDDKSAPLDFSELTPFQFGISAQSFTPASLSNRKDKSRLAQVKARRKSSVGVRGSPETNSLIRFIGQQRMKTPPVSRTPELVKSSPFLPRVASTLRQKMASFQNLMDVEESEGCDPMPKQDSDTGGCIKTRDYLSDGGSHDGEKENQQPMVTPRKRRRLGPLESCKVEIREASTPILHFSLQEREEEKKQEPQIVTEGPLTSRDTVDEAEAVFLSPTLHVDSELRAGPPAKNPQDAVFELQSPRHSPPDDPAAAPQAQPASILHFPFLPSLPSLLEMKPAGEVESTGTSTVKKTKRVRFGGPLSPEFFDKNLPPSTPLQRGATPARAQTPGGSLQLRSLLKTPQGRESQTANAQLDLGSPTVFGASPTLAVPRNHRTPTAGDEDGKVNQSVFLSVEDVDSAVITDTECTWDIQPLNLNNAFHEECLPQILSEFETEPDSASQLDALDEPTALPEEEKRLEAEAEIESTSRKRKQPAPTCESSSEDPARSSRKRKPEESEPVKRSTRSAAKSASGKMKNCSTAARRWNKDVDRSLYGSRAYASKNPALSPITERLSFLSQCPAEQQTPTSAQNDEPCLSPEVADDAQVISNPTTINASENSSEDSVPASSKQSVKGRGRLSGRRVRGRGLKEMRVSAAKEMAPCLSEETRNQTGGEKEDHCEDQAATHLEKSREETPLSDTAPDQGGADIDLEAQISADTPCTDSDSKLECLSALTSDSSSLPEESSCTASPPPEVAQRRYKQGRRSSLYRPVPEEQVNQAEEHQMSRDVQESGQGDHAANQEEHNSRTSSDSQEEGEVTRMDLAPWQAEFNFEDVFKPVATRGQRSVRRSLRNQGSDSAGLAWLPWTSPESCKESRRRTRGRRLSAAQPAQQSVPEETPDAE